MCILREADIENSVHILTKDFFYKRIAEFLRFPF